MFGIFVNSFSAASLAVLQIFVIAASSALLTKRKLITEEHTTALASIVVRILLPCLIFANIIQRFEPSELKIWPLIPLAAVLMIFLGLAGSAVLLGSKWRQKKYLLAAASFQNAGYLVLPIGRALYPEHFEEFALYCFLYILGLSPVLWSLGKYLISPSDGEKLSVKKLFSPPFFANILAVIFVFTNLRRFIPETVLTPIDLVGSATVPVATIVLGSILGGIKLDIKSHLADAIKILSVKLFLIPLVTIILLYMSGHYLEFPILCNLLVIQSTAAPAVSVIIQSRHYGGNQKEIGSIFLLSYLACVITIPLWLGIWGTLIK